MHYQEDWVNGQAIPSCECNGLAGGQASCFDDQNWITMVGPSLASGIATLRGYEGKLFSYVLALPPPCFLSLRKKLSHTKNMNFYKLQVAYGVQILTNCRYPI